MGQGGDRIRCDSGRTGEKVVTGERVVGVLCGAFAAVVGPLSVVGIIVELKWGAVHGPSLISIALATLPMSIVAGLVSHALLRPPRK